MDKSVLLLRFIGRLSWKSYTLLSGIIFFSGGYSTEYLKHILNIVFNQLLLTTRVAEIFKHNDVVSTRYANANGTV